MLNLEVSINLNVGMPEVGRAALTADLPGNRRATGVMLYMPAIIDWFSDRDWTEMFG